MSLRIVAWLGLPFIGGYYTSYKCQQTKINLLKVGTGVGLGALTFSSVITIVFRKIEKSPEMKNWSVVIVGGYCFIFILVPTISFMSGMGTLPLMKVLSKTWQS